MKSKSYIHALAAVTLVTAMPIYGFAFGQLAETRSQEAPIKVSKKEIRGQSENRFGSKGQGKTDTSITGNSLRDKKALAKPKGPIDGGGGATYKENGELKTLAEAGFIFKAAYSEIQKTAYPRYYNISKETEEALQKIQDTIHQKYPWVQLGNDILGQRGTFIDQTQIDPNLYSKIKKDYNKVLQKHRSSLNADQLTLVAYSQKGKTYILTDFENLNPYRQALILIHERFMRQASDVNQLSAVLELDSQIYKILKSADGSLAMGDPTALLATLNKLGVIKPCSWCSNPSAAIMLAYLQTKIDRPILLGDLVANISDRPVAFDAPADPSIMQKFNEHVPSLAPLFAGVRIRVGGVTGIYNGKEFSERIKFCEENKSILESREAQPNEHFVVVKKTSVIAFDCKNGSLLERHLDINGLNFKK